MRLFGRVILVLLAVVGSFALLITALGLWAAFAARPAPLPSQMTLELDVDDGVVEALPDGPFARLGMPNAYALKDVVEALDKAARDPRVSALVARIDSPSLGMARAQELRDAVLAFRKSGKRTVAFSTSFGGSSAGTVPYYLASAFQEIWLQPSGDVALTGFVAQSPFFKGTLDLLGIKPEFSGRYEYKTAIDIFTQTKFTREGKESTERLVESWSRQVTDGIARARNLKAEQVKALIDRAPLMADEAHEAQLVDRLAYWDELEKTLTQKGVKLVDLGDYSARAKPGANAVKVALVYGVGPVQQGEDRDGPLSEAGVMSAERVGKALRDAVKDSSVKAILLRIDSPGGSYTAADAIWREVGNARAAGKPVVVSMGDVAASGGYFAAMPADRIIAQPGTITGSIGVFSGKMVLGDFWKKLGVSWDEIHDGQNATMWSSVNGFSPAAWDRLNAMLDRIYADFTGKAEQARHIKPEDMDRIARGRIWSGEDAKRLGLIDDTGGYAEAMVLLRQLARLPSQMPIDLVPFPQPKGPLDYLLELARTGRLPADVSGHLASEARLAAMTQTLKPLTALFPGRDDVLRMPPVEGH